jgi:hypothetical protein
MDYNLILLGTILFLVVIKLPDNGQLMRLKVVERKLDLILEHLGLNPNKGVDLQILELVKSNQKIAAIKLYREQTGVGLKEAKDYVESL